MRPAWKIYIAALAMTLPSDLGCRHDVAEVCAKDFADYDQKIDAAIIQVKADCRKKTGHLLASVIEVIEPTQVDNAWSSWAEDRLKESQRFIDITGRSNQVKAIRAELSELATEWVRFLGYAQLEQRERMVVSLERIRTIQRRARAIACEPARFIGPKNQVR